MTLHDVTPCIVTQCALVVSQRNSSSTATSNTNFNKRPSDVMLIRTCHSGDVHLGQVPGLEDDDGQSVDGGRVAERHQHLTTASRLHLSNTQRNTARATQLEQHSWSNTAGATQRSVAERHQHLPAASRLHLSNTQQHS